MIIWWFDELEPNLVLKGVDNNGIIGRPKENFKAVAENTNYNCTTNIKKLLLKIIIIMLQIKKSIAENNNYDCTTYNNKLLLKIIIIILL